MKQPVTIQLRVELDQLDSMLRSQIENLQSEEKNVKEASKTFQEIRNTVKKVHFQRETVQLDIGGTIFKTSLATLRTREPETSLLANMFSGDGISVEADEDGNYFIDRDGTNFRHILNYLRGNFRVSHVDPVVKRELLDEANFYGLPGMMKLLASFICIWTNCNAATGIIRHLGLKSGCGLPGLIVMKPSSASYPGNVQQMLFPSTDSRGEGGACSMKGQHFDFSFTQHRIAPSHYAFTHLSCQAPKDWQVSGSCDGVTWVMLHNAVNKPASATKTKRSGWEMNYDPSLGPFTSIRIKLVDSHGGAGCLHINNFEIWGELSDLS